MIGLMIVGSVVIHDFYTKNFTELLHILRNKKFLNSRTRTGKNRIKPLLKEFKKPRRDRDNCDQDFRS